MKYAFLFLCSAFFLLGCKSEPAAEEQAPEGAESEGLAVADSASVQEAPAAFEFPDIEGKIWVLSRFEYDGKDYRPQEGTRAVLTIRGNELTGNATCNNLNANVALGEDGTIAINKAVTTKMRCPGLMTQEMWVLELLESAKTYRVNKVVFEVESPKGILSYRLNRQK